jgi:hypothetical protein
MLLHDSSNSEMIRRRALGKVYALLIRLAEEKAKQTALPDNFGEETGKAEEQTPTVVETCND